MKIVDKGWAVWRPEMGEYVLFGPLCKCRTNAIASFLDRRISDSWNAAREHGYRVLRTTATATVAKKKARRK